MDPLRLRYQAMLQDPDPLQRAVAREQLKVLDGVKPAVRREPSTSPPPRTDGWPLAVLTDLFTRAGNRLSDRGDRVLTAHEPVHGSRSGNCLVIWTDPPHWWCSSCHQGGDAIAAIRSLEGCSYPAALARLTDRYGAPGVRHG